MLLIAYLAPQRYHGLELDEFELRAFLGLELALENIEMALAKEPVVLRSRTFEFEKLLRSGHGSGHFVQADTVVFSSVLKSTMPESLRRKALCNAASVLKPNGTVVVFGDCHGLLIRIAEEVGAFTPPAQLLDEFGRPRCGEQKCRTCFMRRLPNDLSPTCWREGEPQMRVSVMTGLMIGIGIVIMSVSVILIVSRSRQSAMR